MRDPVGPLTPPDINIIPDQESYSMTSEPGASSEYVIIHGQVTCEMPDGAPPGTVCNVQIFVEKQFGGGETLPLMVFTKEILKLEFTSEIYVEPRAPASKTIAVTIYGNWNYEGGIGTGDVSSKYVNIHVVQYGALELKDTYISGTWGFDVGKWEVFSIRIRNFGNGDDNVTLGVVDLPVDLEVEIEFKNFLLRMNGERELFIKVRQNGGGSRTGVIKFQCISSFSGTYSVDTLEVNYRTDGQSGGPEIETLMTVGAVLFIVVVFITVWVAYTRVIRKRRS